MRAHRIGTRTWMLETAPGRCQPLKYLEKHRETAPRVLARIEDVDRNGPPANQELFRWLDGRSDHGYRICEYKVHHPHACRAFAFMTDRGFVIARIEDKTDNARRLNEILQDIGTLIDTFTEEGEFHE